MSDVYTMELSIREAATLTGKSPRTLRAQVARGEVPGHKRGGRWYVSRRSLPLTEDQRLALQSRADEVRRAVEDALPSRTASRRGRGRRSVTDLDAFRAGRELLVELTAACEGTDERHGCARARASLEAALLDLCEGTHAFDRPHKIERLRRARDGISRSLGLLLLSTGPALVEPQLSWIERLENDVLPSLGGLLRWAERLRTRNE